MTSNMKNYMEEVVFMMLSDIISKMEICQCDKCKYDIAAIALNSLPAKYVVSQRGELYSRIESLKQQFEVDITTAITKAAVIVKKGPRHL